jgi:hypothetical protein
MVASSVDYDNTKGGGHVSMQQTDPQPQPPEDPQPLSLSQPTPYPALVQPASKPKKSWYRSLVRIASQTKRAEATRFLSSAVAEAKEKRNKILEEASKRRTIISELSKKKQQGQGQTGNANEEGSVHEEEPVSPQQPVPPPTSVHLPSSPPTTQEGEGERYLLQKVEGNTPYICYAGIGLLLLLSLWQPAAVFVLSCWACWWILYFSYCAIASEHRHNPTHWSQRSWFHKHMKQTQMEIAEREE